MARKNRPPEENAPVERKSVSCCKWQTSAAWMTSRICSRRPLPSLRRIAWKLSWMKSLATASMTTRTSPQTTAGTATAARRCAPVLAMWRCLFPGTGSAPQLLKKNQTSIGRDIEEKILSMYAKGMTTIEARIRDTYGGEVFDGKPHYG